MTRPEIIRAGMWHVLGTSMTLSQPPKPSRSLTSPRFGHTAAAWAIWGVCPSQRSPHPVAARTQAPCAATPDQNNADSLASTFIQTRLISKIAKHPPQRTTLPDPVPSTPPSLPPTEPRLTRPRPYERSLPDKQRRNFTAPESLGPTAARLATCRDTPKTWPPELRVP